VIQYKRPVDAFAFNVLSTGCPCNFVIQVLMCIDERSTVRFFQDRLKRLASFYVPFLLFKGGKQGWNGDPGTGNTEYPEKIASQKFGSGHTVHVMEC
jgi:hypothetical protein